MLPSITGLPKGKLKKPTILSNELVLGRWNNGVKLHRPNAEESKMICFKRKPSIAKLHVLPFNIYLNSGGIIHFANESTIKMCGFDSQQKAIGNTVASVAKKETFLFEEEHDRQVVKNNRMVVMQENFQRHNGQDTLYISLKFPWYNEENKIVGIFGCSIPTQVDNHYFSNVWLLLIETGLLSPSLTHHSFQSKLVSITRREKDIMNLLIRGKTAKELAVILGLSSRTIEHYIEKLKMKFNVTRKSELIEKSIECLNDERY